MSSDPARVSALIPAAGSGERLGMGPKALLMLNRISLLERSIAAFHGVASEIIVALPIDLVLELPEGVRRVAGGATRQESVYNLLEAATFETVLIHDAARPFLPKTVIERVLSATLETDAATAALPATDTLILESAGDWGSVLDRSQIRAVQTPQGFNRALLREAHNWARLKGIAATDDAGLVARLGQRVMLALGDERLFKVTRPGDWALAEAFAGVWDVENVVVGARHASPLRVGGAGPSPNSRPPKSTSDWRSRADSRTAITRWIRCSPQPPSATRWRSRRPIPAFSSRCVDYHSATLETIWSTKQPRCTSSKPSKRAASS